MPGSRLVLRTRPSRQPAVPVNGGLSSSEADNRKAVDVNNRRNDHARRQTSSSPQRGAGAVCEHTGVVGFCGQCDGQWVVQASGVTYVFDLGEAAMVTIMPRDDDDFGVPAYPQLLKLAQDLGGMSVGKPMDISAHDSFGQAVQITGHISYIASV